VIGVERIPQAVEDGTLTSAAEPAFTEEKRWRHAFMAWDRIRTGDRDPWSCILCRRDYSGIDALAVLGVIDDPRTDHSASRSSTEPVAVALVCASCASASPERLTQNKPQKKWVI
jgi:hypothetical protein